MKNNIYSIKGTKDILPDDSIKWRFIENKVHKIMKNWGFASQLKNVYLGSTIAKFLPGPMAKKFFMDGTRHSQTKQG